MNDLGNKKIMAENIMYYMDINGKTRIDLCKDLNLKYTTVTGWVTGEKYPRIDSIEKMANYFGISKGDLVERHIKKPAPESESGLNAEIKNYLDLLTEDELRILHAQIKGIISSREQ